MEVDYEYDSDMSGQSSAHSYSTEESNDLNDVNEEEEEEFDDQDMIYTIKFEKTKTKRLREAIIVDNCDFDLVLWNHAHNIGPRTNNHVEGFHNRLNKWIKKPHPDTYQLISVFQKIDNKVSVDFQTRILGTSAPKRKKIDIEKDTRYQNLRDHLENNSMDLVQYLSSCTYLVNFNNIMHLI
ncbi:unnamed protein product [Brachionus calyciflorus]|uniref:Uncharacterized protein n=1 Tax=Brachionus calyciflorus TaxID=104777 RepID=A0A813MAF9_9BILA|nr:unnamed protein product [Brachionus calyciflorus]